MRLERFQREEEALVARETGEVRHDDAFVPPPPIVFVVFVFSFSGVLSLLSKKNERRQSKKKPKQSRV